VSVLPRQSTHQLSNQCCLALTQGERTYIGPGSGAGKPAEALGLNGDRAAPCGARPVQQPMRVCNID